ncbi:MAG: hypothetical protein EP330_11395 [Deltaproteobacteria bacterium]|nr:MAG: hypothetical protein EP330_11395 [Deltaproteobacteria bacterium]
MTARERPELAGGDEAPRLRPTESLDGVSQAELGSRPLRVEQVRPRPESGSLGRRWLRWALKLLPLLLWEVR